MPQTKVALALHTFLHIHYSPCVPDKTREGITRPNLNVLRNRVLISTGNMVTLQNMGPVRGENKRLRIARVLASPLRHEHREKDSETHT